MDTIVYLLLEKEMVAGELTDSTPVFIIREHREICRIIYVDIPASWKILSEQDKKSVSIELDQTENIKKGKNSQKNFLERWHQAVLKVSKALFNGQTSKKWEGQQNKWQEPVAPLWAEELLEYLKPFLWNTPIAYCICDCSVEKWLKQQQLCEWWKQYWSLPVFQEYHRKEFLECLLEQAYHCKNCPSHYLILGYNHLILPILWQNARKIKSLKLVLAQLPEELEEGLEELNEEFGLIASIQLQPQINVIQSLYPVLVFDFTGKEKLLLSEVAQGSIWLDMDSLEEKRRRIEGRNTGITYFSMKKHWKRIDTLFKNRYNTKVN